MNLTKNEAFLRNVHFWYEVFRFCGWVVNCGGMNRFSWDVLGSGRVKLRSRLFTLSGIVLSFQWRRLPVVPSKKLIIGQRLMRRVQSDNERISEKEKCILAHFQDFLTILNCNMLPLIIFACNCLSPCILRTHTMFEPLFNHLKKRNLEVTEISYLTQICKVQKNIMTLQCLVHPPY